MTKRNGGCTYYLKPKLGRQLVWFSLILSAISLLIADKLPSSPLPSDNSPSDHFLTFNGIDDAVSACKYYEAIGAIINPNPSFKDCDRVDPGNFVFLQPDDGINFNDWKIKNGLRVNPDANGNNNPFDDDPNTGEVSALYFNAVDLALARSMHGKTSIINGVKTTAYYVCNYKTLEDALKDPDNRSAVACVTFDYSADRPFTKFYVFERGFLVASVDLDGKGKKFVPGLCKVCHGADKERRQKSAGNADIGAHFLPFDLDNFDYLADTRFSRKAQESKFKQLNQMIVNDTDPAPVVRELINGWYANTNEQNSPFVARGWKGHDQLYRNVVKPFCRTCHVAMPPDVNFNRFENLAANDPQTAADDTQGSFKDRFKIDDKINAGLIENRVCQTYLMPNSRVTFDLFWVNRVARAVLGRFLRDTLENPSLECPPP